MTANDVLNIKKQRFSTLEEKPKNIKCPGVVKKLSRQIRNMEAR